MYAVFDFDSHIVLHTVAVGVSLSLHVCHVKATYMNNHALYELNSHIM